MKPRGTWVTGEPEIQITMSKATADKLHALLTKVGGCREIYDLLAAMGYGDDEAMFFDFFQIAEEDGDLTIRPLGDV